MASNLKIKKFVVGPLFTNCYLVYFKNRGIIIDPGGFPDEILDFIEKNKIKIDYIINTHYHSDHTFANNFLKEKTKAKIAIYELEKDYIKFPVDKFLTDGEKIIIGKENLKVLHTPGHTKGSICLFGKNLVFSGDTLFKEGFGRTDLLGGSEKELQNSLNLLSNKIKEGTIIYPGHGESFVFKKDILNKKGRQSGFK
jgi:glyoxylase-like metal-dependent hydrolase (beta-lactamase superfamily II)